MPTPRKPTTPTTEAIDQFCAHFDDLLPRYEERTALRQYLIGLLLPREHNKTLVELGAIVPGAERQRLHHFLHDAPWDVDALNRRRLAQWQAHPVLAPHAGGVLIVDETGDPKRGHRLVLAAQQYLGKLGHVANGVVAVTSHWADGSRHLPLGVKPYRPASRLPKGRKDPDFQTKPQLAWQLIEEARTADVPFRLVVADSIYGENADLEAKLFGAKIPYIMGLKPSHGTWQQVDDPANPPAFTPAEAAARLPLAAWKRTVRFDSHGKELVRSIAELELGTSYGPSTGIRLVAATLDPTQLKPESTWYLATSLPLAQVSAEQVYELYRLRDWIEHYYKPVKHELGWADYQMRPERAIVRHWQLVLLAYTFSLLVGAEPPSPPERAAGGKIRANPLAASQRRRVRGAGRLERGAAPGAGVAVPVGSAAALLETLVEHRPTARVGRAPRPRRALPPA
ncbi:MAG TPA: IS701 family transposase [Ktedonobacterales bacterium]|nr:IS701 family transposase [Ktedonobacterales bacterium]